MVEGTVRNEAFAATKTLVMDVDVLAVTGKGSEDRVNAGLRSKAEKVYDMPLASVHNGQRLGRSLPGAVASHRIVEVLQPHRNAAGLPVAMRIKPQGVECMLQLGDDWRVAPSDALTLALEQVLGAREVAVEY